VYSTVRGLVVAPVRDTVTSAFEAPDSSPSGLGELMRTVGNAEKAVAAESKRAMPPNKKTAFRQQLRISSGRKWNASR